jgi:hypothetical protein
VKPALRVIFAAGVIAGVLDIAWVIVFYGFRGVAASRILQGIAAGLIGRERAMAGGLSTAALGLALHFVIAFGAAAMFYAASRKLRWLTAQPWISGPVFGVAVWFFMNLVVLPLSATPPRVFPAANWPVILAAHVLCVGLPIALIVRRWGVAARSPSV